MLGVWVQFKTFATTILIYSAAYISFMAALTLDREQREKLSKGSGLEGVLRDGVPPHIRQLILHSREVQEHAAHCQQFDPDELRIGEALREPLAVPSPPVEEKSLPREEKREEEGQHQRTHEQLSRTSPLGKEYGVGAGFIPVTCTCGQTLDVRSSVNRDRYMHDTFGTSDPARGTYLSSPRPVDSGEPSLYGPSFAQGAVSAYGTEDTRRSRRKPTNGDYAF